MKKPRTHHIEIGGVVRDLLVGPVPNLPVDVAFFDMLGDWEMAEAAAAELVKLIPPGVEALVMPNGKATSLLHAMGRLTGFPTIVARKEIRPHMRDVVSVGDVKSATTEGLQAYHLDGIDAERLRGKKVAFVDDVVSTRGSLRSLQALLDKIGGVELVAIMAVFTEGAKPHEDVISLGHLPLFHK